MDNLSGPQASAQDKDGLKARMAEGDPEKLLPLWSDLLRWQPQEAFAELTVPIHAINGDLIPDTAKARCRPWVTEHRLDGAGHFPQMEMPERFHRTLRGVLVGIGGQNSG